MGWRALLAAPRGFDAVVIGEVRFGPPRPWVYPAVGEVLQVGARRPPWRCRPQTTAAPRLNPDQNDVGADAAILATSRALLRT